MALAVIGHFDPVDPGEGVSLLIEHLKMRRAVVKQKEGRKNKRKKGRKEAFDITHHFDPVVPAKGELFFVYEAVAVFVKHLEDVARSVLGQWVDVAFIVAEQSAAD